MLSAAGAGGGGTVALKEATTRSPSASARSRADWRVMCAMSGKPQSRLTRTRRPAGSRRVTVARNAFRTLDERASSRATATSSGRTHSSGKSSPAGGAAATSTATSPMRSSVSSSVARTTRAGRTFSTPTKAATSASPAREPLRPRRAAGAVVDEDRDAVGERQGLVAVVCHEDRGRAAASQRARGRPGAPRASARRAPRTARRGSSSGSSASARARLTRCASPAEARSHAGRRVRRPSRASSASARPSARPR